MKKVVFERFGPPSKVVECVTSREPVEPGPWDVVVDITVSPVNPADLSILRGQYGTLPQHFPATPGQEGAGVVSAVGAEISDFKEGDRVMVIANDNWCQRRAVRSTLVFKTPEGLDDIQAAMLKANALCAYLILRDAVELQAGDFLIQSAPLSAVGRMVIGMAKARGVNTVNVVRRAEAISEVKELGGDIAIADGEDLAEKVAAETDGGQVVLGLDAVAGAQTSRLADCLDNGAPLYVYGMLSGEPCHLRPDHLIFRNIQARGFWVANYLNRMSLKDRHKAIGECADTVVKHGLANLVDKTFELTEIAEALKYAESPERHGKVLLLPNGPLAA